MLELLVQGGPLMLPIALASVTAVAVFLERLHALRRSRVLPPSLGPAVRAALAEHDPARARAECEKRESAGGVVLAAVLDAAGRGRAEMRQRAEDVGRRQVASLDRYVGVLGVIAAVTPLLGLLGTVTGMIAVFREVVTKGVGDPSLLAEGIWEALITTAAGLTVAIPAYLGYRYLLSKVADLSLELEEEASAVSDMLLSDVEAAGSQTEESGA
ncbi:MAG: MotA/TolQ/ExbB proton channel family protein [Myxococcota bacterium]